MRFLSELQIEWLTRDENASGPMARVLSPLRFTYDGHTLYVPARFVTDHASVPRIFWNLIPPVDPRWNRAAVVHDYGYRFAAFPREEGGFLQFRSRKAVDCLFLNAMAVDGAGWLARRTIYRAVRVGGWVAWNKYRDMDKKLVDQIKRVQAALGVEVDGIAGPITWGAIARHLGLEPCPSITETIRLVQARLAVAVDGIAGPQTWGAIENAVSGNNSGRLLAHARKDAGLKETAGSASTARIKQAILAAASWLDPDDSVTAWCGCIMGLWYKEPGYRPRRNTSGRRTG